MRPLFLLAPLALALVPASAGAAEIQTDRACYLQTPQTTVSVSGTGFAPDQPYSVALGGAPLDGGAGNTDAGGAMHGAFNPPALAVADNERTFSVAVQSGDLAPAATFTVTRFLAGFSPTKGDPASLRVRFSVFGFALVDESPVVYVHYVSPAGKLRKTVRLGRAQGQCGSVTGGVKRRLFPFSKPSHGKWKLQFDTSQRYRAGSKGSSFLFYTVAVRVRSA